MRRSRAIELVLVLVATAYAAVAIVRAPAWTVDDAWIVCRYADHLVHHGTLAWNLDGPKVEGFTSLSAVLYAALASFLGIPPMKALVALGEVSLLATGPLLLALGRALRAPAPAAGLVAFAHLTAAEHITHATSGLETEVFIALSLGLAIAVARRSTFAVALLATLLVLTRPEGLAAGLVAIAVTLRHGPARERILPILVAFVLPMIGLFLWRYVTFGVLVPNTYFAKQGTWNRASLRDLWSIANAQLLDLVVIAVASLFLAMRPRPRVRLDVAFVAVVAIAAHAVAYARSEPIMDYAKRFAMHSVAWLDVLALLVIGKAAHARTPKLRAVTALALVGLVVRGSIAAGFERQRMDDYETSMARACMPTIEWILEHTSADATIAVYPDAGVIPYRTRRRTIDFGRLNDPTLARGPHTPEAVTEYFFRTAPDLLVASRHANGRLYDAGAEAIVRDPRFSARYTLGHEQLGPTGVGYLLFAKRSP